MDSKENKEITFAPTKFTNFLTFIIFYLWTTRLVQNIEYRAEYGAEEIYNALSNYPSFSLYAACITTIIGYFLTLWAIILILKKSRECVFSIRMALVFMMLSQILVSPYSYSEIGPAITNIFVVLCLCYFLFSKKIKSVYPKEERRIGKSGLAWITINAIYILAIAGQVIHFFNSEDYENESFNIRDSNMFVGENFYLNKVDSSANIVTYAGGYADQSVMTHNIATYTLLKAYSREKTEELSFKDTIIDSNQVYINRFRIFQDTIPKEISVATIYELKSSKMIALKTNGDMVVIDSVLTDIDFDLKEGILKKSINQIDSTNQHDPPDILKDEK